VLVVSVPDVGGSSSPKVGDMFILGKNDWTSASRIGESRRYSSPNTWLPSPVSTATPSSTAFPSLNMVQFEHLAGQGTDRSPESLPVLTIFR